MPDQQLGAEFIGTFAMVFVGCAAISVELSQPGVIGHVGVSLILARRRRDDLRHRAYLRGAFQPAVRSALRHRALSVAPGSSPARSPSAPALVAWRYSSGSCPSMSAGDRDQLESRSRRRRGAADLSADVCDRRRRHGSPRRGAARRCCDWRNGRLGCLVRWPAHRRLDEPGAQPRPWLVLGRAAQLGLYLVAPASVSLAHGRTGSSALTISAGRRRVLLSVAVAQLPVARS